jgi:hypothetical protein
MIDAITALLQNDAMLTAILTGGVHHAQEISRQTTPAAFDANKELKPCALIKQETATPWGVHRDSGRLYVVIYFYDRHGYTNIEAARQRVYHLLHRVKVESSYEVRHANDVLDREDEVLGAAMTISRYVVTMERV